MKKILKYAGENMKYVYLSALVLFISVILGIVPFFLLNEIIISLLEGTFVLETAIKIILLICLSLVFKAIAFGGGLGLSHIGAFNIIENMRNTFLKDMARQPMGHILDKGTGKYKKTFVEDVSLLESTLAHTIPEGVPAVFGVLTTLVVIFFIDYRIGFIVLVMIPVSMSPMAYMMKVGMEKMPKFYEKRDVLNHTLIEYVSGMEVVKVFNRVTKSFDKLAKATKDNKDFTIEWCKVTWKSMSVLYSLLPCTLLVPLPVGVYFYINGSLTLSSLTLLIMLCLSLGEPLLKLISFMPSIPIAEQNIKKIEAVFKHDDVINGAFEAFIDSTKINFENVSFAYKDKNVLSNVSFEIEEKNIYALVGPSGSGKSTIAKLLMHFWDVNEGSIKIGGKDIREFSFDNLMRHITYVSQENTLFEGTIFENIVLDNREITKVDVIQLCKKANCHEFISHLPHGYETNVGTLGNKLSGGERQRITIARAMVKDAPIVVLDEATSFADTQNEFLIQEALSSLLQDKTVLLIAHKLHTITEVDKIIVMNDGGVEAIAPHNELLNNSGTYKVLFEQNEKSINWNLEGIANA
ncbi:MAG: ABC transporter ATP-binding protein [Cyclobacteriaceae bacterium]